VGIIKTDLTMMWFENGERISLVRYCVSLQPFVLVVSKIRVPLPEK